MTPSSITSALMGQERRTGSLADSDCTVQGVAADLREFLQADVDSSGRTRSGFASRPQPQNWTVSFLSIEFRKQSLAHVCMSRTYVYRTGIPVAGDLLSCQGRTRRYSSMTNGGEKTGRKGPTVKHRLRERWMPAISPTLTYKEYQRGVAQ